MGGAKKRTLAQAEKQQTQARSEEKKQGTPKSKTVAEKKVGSIDLPDQTEKELMAELSKMRAITPYQVASRYNVKMSVAKNLLSKMEQRGHIKMVSRNANVKIYTAIGAA